jgi:hypothetical protein
VGPEAIGEGFNPSQQQSSKKKEKKTWGNILWIEEILHRLVNGKHPKKISRQETPNSMGKWEDNV